MDPNNTTICPTLGGAPALYLTNPYGENFELEEGEYDFSDLERTGFFEQREHMHKKACIKEQIRRETKETLEDFSKAIKARSYWEEAQTIRNLEIQQQLEADELERLHREEDQAHVKDSRHCNYRSDDCFCPQSFSWADETEFFETKEDMIVFEGDENFLQESFLSTSEESRDSEDSDDNDTPPQNFSPSQEESQASQSTSEPSYTRSFLSEIFDTGSESSSDTEDSDSVYSEDGEAGSSASRYQTETGTTTPVFDQANPCLQESLFSQLELAELEVSLVHEEYEDHKAQYKNILQRARNHWVESQRFNEFDANAKGIRNDKFKWIGTVKMFVSYPPYRKFGTSTNPLYQPHHFSKTSLAGPLG